MRQAARTVPIAGTAWGRALLASCLHMLAADIPGNQKKNKYLITCNTLPTLNLGHRYQYRLFFIIYLDYVKSSFLKGNLYFFLLNSEGYLN